CTLSHVPERIDIYGLHDDYTIHPFESINRLMSTGRKNSMSRGYETYAATRLIVNSYLVRKLPAIIATPTERKLLDLLFGSTAKCTSVTGTTQVAQPMKSNRYSSFAPGKYYRTMTIAEYTFKIRDFVQLVSGEFGRIEAISVSQGSVSVIISIYPTTPTIDYMPRIHSHPEVASLKSMCFSSNIHESAVYYKHDPITTTVVLSNQIRCKALYSYSEAYAFPVHLFTSLYIRTRYE
ncbi:hypothetical protein PMAYCL1PPCAC_10401, partial [Pristionchus mayeri]